MGDRYINYDNVCNPTHYLTASNSFTDANANMTWTRGSLLKSYITGGNTVTFDYNVQGRRFFKDTTGGYTKRYYLDGGKILGEDWSNGTKIRYIYNLTGLAGFYLDGEIGQFGGYVYAKDAQGNIVNIFKDNYLVASYDYDAWGNCTVYDANGNITTANNHIGNINPFRWKSHYFDTETGFYYINGRYYDPAMMQFINSDYSTLNSYKIGGLNPYSICSAFSVDNPLHIPANGANIYTSIPLVSNGSESSSSGGLFGGMPNWLKWTIGGIVIAGCIIAIPFTGGASSLFIPAAIGAGISGTVGAIAGGLSFKNGVSWDWDSAADGFMWGSITGAISGYLGGYVGGPQFAQTWWQQGLWNAGINMGLTAGQQLITVGTIDPLAVGISGVFGFAGGAIGITGFGQYANGAISGIGLGLAEALAGVLYDNFVVNAQAYDAYLMCLFGLRRNPFAYL